MKSRFEGLVIIIKRSYRLIFRFGSKVYDHDKYTILIMYTVMTEIQRSLAEIYDLSLESIL